MNEFSAQGLRRWIGKVEVMHDTITEAHAQRMAALLDRSAVPRGGDPLPPLWHWIYFTPRTPSSGIGADGHPKLGDFLPPFSLPRRMWAGGRLTFHAPLHIGETVTRETEIVSITEKRGKRGALVFVTLRHTLTSEFGRAIEEEQDLVYRDISATPRPGPVDGPGEPSAWRETVIPDPVFLFRYSALTFNAHRIHYDLPYATATEGYPALVVHGPLTATLMADALVRQTGRRLQSFDFRGHAPLFGDSPFQLCGRATDGSTGDEHEIWAEGPGGYLAMSARARLGEG